MGFVPTTAPCNFIKLHDFGHLHGIQPLYNGYQRWKFLFYTLYNSKMTGRTVIGRIYAHTTAMGQLYVRPNVKPMAEPIRPRDKERTS